MKRTVNIDKEYRCSAEKAIEKFFTEHGKAKFNEANQRALKIGYEKC